MPDDVVLIIGHGSRVGDANGEFEALAAAYRAARPHLRVETAYIELASPLVEDALACLALEARRIVVVPLFLFAAGHVKTDIPRAVARVRRAHPSVDVLVAPPLGVHPGLIELAWERASRVVGPDPARRAGTLLLVVGRGASDPDANGDFCKVARMIGEGRGLLHVEPTFIGITEPLVPTSLDLVARIAPERVVVLPYMLFAGRLVRRLERQIAEFSSAHPSIEARVAPHLAGEAAVDERLCAILDERRVAAMRSGAAPRCDRCHSVMAP